MMRRVLETPRRLLGVSSLALALAAPSAAFAGDTIALLKDINPGYEGDVALGSSPRGLVKLGGFIYFRAADGNDGFHNRLWRTDGTPEGTTAVPGSPLDPAVLTPLGDAVFFQASDAEHGYELWSYAPATGAFAEYDMNAGPASSSPVYLTVFQESLFFRAVDAAGHYGLWKVGQDGVPELVKGLSQAYYGGPDNLTVIGDALYFVGEEAQGVGRRLWRTDGTPEGVKPVGPSGLRLPAPDELVGLTPFGDRLFFAAKDMNDDHGIELWTSDGNAEDPAGTHEVVDLYPGTSVVSGVNSSSPGPFAVLNGVLHFRARTADGVGLWSTDGTAERTVPIKVLSPFDELSPMTMVPVGDLLFFVARDDRGRELWRSDGTADGTHLVADICNPAQYPDNPLACGPWLVGGEPHNSSNPVGLTAHAGKVYFSAYHPDYGRELFRSDGSTVELVADTYPGSLPNEYWGRDFPNSSFATPIAEIDGTLYLSADDGLVGEEPRTLRSHGQTPQEQIAELVDDIQDLVGAGTLNEGQGNSLVVKLQNALQVLEAGDTETALSLLEAFIHEVRACENARKLTAEEADALVESAERVIASISV